MAEDLTEPTPCGSPAPSPIADAAKAAVTLDRELGQNRFGLVGGQVAPLGPPMRGQRRIGEVGGEDLALRAPHREGFGEPLHVVDARDPDLPHGTPVPDRTAGDEARASLGGVIGPYRSADPHRRSNQWSCWASCSDVVVKPTRRPPVCSLVTCPSLSQMPNRRLATGAALTSGAKKPAG